MSTEITSRLKALVRHVPPGFVVDSAWLDRQGIGPKSIRGYVRQGWLEKVTRGVYRRPFLGKDFSYMQDWDTALASIQRIMGYRVHLGGSSALKIRGYGNCMWPEEGNPVYLYGSVPPWLSQLRLESGARFHVRSRSLFGDDLLGIENCFCSEYGVPLSLSDAVSADTGGSDPADDDETASYTKWKLLEPRWPIHVSTPERAAMEALEDFPGRGTFHDLDMMFLGLSGMRPKHVTPLLRTCRSVKVKRLFFVLAERHSHIWLDYVDKKTVDFGSGPRALAKGGRLHPVYRIYVPDELLAPFEYNHESLANVQ